MLQALQGLLEPQEPQAILVLPEQQVLLVRQVLKDQQDLPVQQEQLVLPDLLVQLVQTL